jgi:hypothetical protein
MTDEKNETNANSATPAAEPESKIILDGADAPSMWGVPLESFVRGNRSRPASHDRMMAEEEADAERRRSIAAKERAQAKVPIHQGGAMLYTNKFQDSPESAESFFSLEYVTSSGEPMYLHGQQLGCLADVQVTPEGAIQFHIVCPQCKANDVPQGRCQMRVDSRNKKFDLDGRTAGEMVIFNDGFGAKAYRSAGTIRETERIRCDQCGWACRIVNNKVRAD